MDLSIIIPSRLAADPSDRAGERLFLDRALAGARGQSLFAGRQAPEIVVGLDPGVVAPDRAGVRFIHAAAPGQAQCVNAAVAAATGEVIAILEDDDWWEPGWLAVAVAYLPRFDLVTGNQLAVDLSGEPLYIFDFPTPSSWVMRKALWLELGGMDETFRFHVDTEFLGKVNAAGKKRAHIVESGAAERQNLEWLERVGQRSRIFTSVSPRPLVNRTINPAGGLWLAQSDESAKRISQREHDIMRQRYGKTPW